MEKIFTLLVSGVFCFCAYGEERNELCPFSLGPVCFQPAVGAMYAKKSGKEEYKDLRFAAVLNSRMTTNQLWSWGVMVAPGENVIDAAGFGGAYGLIKLSDKSYAVLNFGVLAKKYTDPLNVRGGAYLMLSYSTF